MISKSNRCRDDAKAMLLLAMLTLPVLYLYGCSGGGATESADDSEWQATVAQALAEIADHGLPQWAEWGRANRGIIGYSEELVPDGNLGYTWQFTDANGGNEYRIALGDRWLALSLAERGLVLLHEMYHARTGNMTHPQELWDLLDQYDVAGG